MVQQAGVSHRLASLLPQRRPQHRSLSCGQRRPDKQQQGRFMAGHVRPTTPCQHLLCCSIAMQPHDMTYSAMLCHCHAKLLLAMHAAWHATPMRCNAIPSATPCQLLCCQTATPSHLLCRPGAAGYPPRCTVPCRTDPWPTCSRVQVGGSWTGSLCA